MPRQALSERAKLQLTVDAVTDRMVGELAAIGIHGTSKAEVACSILRMWLWENQDKLRQNGVFVSAEQPKRART
jgi:hypothetical protein